MPSRVPPSPRSEEPTPFLEAPRETPAHGSTPATPVRVDPPASTRVTHRPKRLKEAASELELLSEAQRALSTDARAALRALREHARQYPEGTLVLERELLEIRALITLEQYERAAKKARRFVREHPDSTYRSRALELAVAAERTTQDAPREANQGSEE